MDTAKKKKKMELYEVMSQNANASPHPGPPSKVQTNTG